MDKSGQKLQAANQEEAKAFAKEQLAEQTQQTKDLFAQGDAARQYGFQQAQNMVAQSIDPQLQAMLQGNMMAQGQYQRTMPQFANALLGRPVDYGAFAPQQMQMPDLSFLTNPAPIYNPQPAAQEVAAASVQQTPGGVNVTDLFGADFNRYGGRMRLPGRGLA